ncbi:hypothetical protein FRC06_001519 [Ceratobasidium sp. 370]|nr:hypothetical protein FRC06_001519 [Ceratobasidium sp. 370]
MAGYELAIMGAVGMGISASAEAKLRQKLGMPKRTVDDIEKYWLSAAENSFTFGEYAVFGHAEYDQLVFGTDQIKQRLKSPEGLEAFSKTLNSPEGQELIKQCLLYAEKPEHKEDLEKAEARYEAKMKEAETKDPEVSKARIRWDDDIEAIIRKLNLTENTGH